jgi:uncharacterized protein YqeY
MALQNQVMDALKAAMKAKDAVALESLRAIKSAILLQQSEAGAKELSPADEIKLLQKLVKQRKDSAALYNQQGRTDLAEPELAQAKVIEQFLPEPLSEVELDQLIQNVINELAAEGMKDMGRVVGEVNSRAAGKAEGKVIAQKVKHHLSN